MYDNIKNIGIALSGGGIRATVFHLGVLKYLAEQNMLGRIVRISSVSGASLAVGLIYSHNSLKWPTDTDYIESVLPRVRNVILKHNIQRIALSKLLYSPQYWNKKVNLLSKTIRDYWGIDGNINNLDNIPKWYINCVTFETGKRFRFSQSEMGDYSIGYLKNPSIPVADAVAASAGYPIAIGTYKLDVDDQWSESRYSHSIEQPYQGKHLHLWDGGIYDNLGMESIFKPDNGGQLSDGVDFMVISNASGPIGYQKHIAGLSIRNLRRLLDISMDQNRTLRTRTIIDYLKRTQSGVYLYVGRCAEYIASKSEVNENVKNYLSDVCLPEIVANSVRDYPTTLSKPTEENFDLILRHGYEVAMCTFTCYQ